MMNQLWRRIVSLSIALFLAVSTLAILPGCRKEGPVEKAGESVDEAVEETGEALD